MTPQAPLAADTIPIKRPYARAGLVAGAVSLLGAAALLALVSWFGKAVLGTDPLGLKRADIPRLGLASLGLLAGFAVVARLARLPRTTLVIGDEALQVVTVGLTGTEVEEQYDFADVTGFHLGQAKGGERFVGIALRDQPSARTRLPATSARNASRKYFGYEAVLPLETTLPPDELLARCQARYQAYGTHRQSAGGSSE